MNKSLEKFIIRFVGEKGLHTIINFYNYFVLFVFYGLIISVTRYETYRIEMLKAMIAPATSTLLSLLHSVIFIPISVVLIIPLRNRINKMSLSIPYLLFLAVYTGLSVAANTLVNSAYTLSGLLIYLAILRPVLNMIYFYCIGDMFHAFNSSLSGIYLVVINATAQLYASYCKDVFMILAGGNYTIFWPISTLAFNYFLLLLAFGNRKLTSPSQPAKTVEISQIFKRDLNIKLYTTRLITYIILYSFLFVILFEVNECMKTQGIYIRALALEKLQQYGAIVTVESVDVSMAPNDSVLTRIANYLSNMYIYPYSNTGKVHKVSNLVVDVTRSNAEVVRGPKALPHSKEITYEVLLGTGLQTMSFLILLYLLNNPGNHILLSIVFLLAPVCQLVMGLILDDSNLLLLTVLFAAIDAGLKKSFKDYFYTEFDYETKNFIRLYMEYAVEPVARLVGSAIGYIVRRSMIVPGNQLQVNLTATYYVYAGIGALWLLSSVIIVYEITRLKRNNKKITIIQ